MKTIISILSNDHEAVEYDRVLNIQQLLIKINIGLFASVLGICCFQLFQ
jgi:hypothetical protein